MKEFKFYKYQSIAILTTTQAIYLDSIFRKLLYQNVHNSEPS